jgi:hypothetical protein
VYWDYTICYFLICQIDAPWFHVVWIGGHFWYLVWQEKLPKKITRLNLPNLEFPVLVNFFELSNVRWFLKCHVRWGAKKETIVRHVGNALWKALLQSKIYIQPRVPIRFAALIYAKHVGKRMKLYKTSGGIFTINQYLGRILTFRLCTLNTGVKGEVPLLALCWCLCFSDKASYTQTFQLLADKSWNCLLRVFNVCTMESTKLPNIFLYFWQELNLISLS